MIAGALLALLVQTAAVPVISDPAECRAYRSLSADLYAALPVRTGGATVAPPSAEAKRLNVARERLAAAIDSAELDLDSIAARLRDYHRVSSELKARLDQAQLECTIAHLRKARPELRAIMLKNIRPRTQTDHIDRLPVAPPAPPAPPPRAPATVEQQR